MTCGIYCIQNTINQKKYIGLSTNIEQRLKNHLISLRNKNTKKENEHLIKSFHKYGEDAFQARIIIVCDQNILAPMEQYLIKIFKTYNPKFGYNKTLGGERNQPTIKTRKKMSESHKGKYIGENSPSYNHNIPNGLKLLKEKEKGIKIIDLAAKYNCSERTIRNRINKVL